jgi:putative transposase
MAIGPKGARHISPGQSRRQPAAPWVRQGKKDLSTVSAIQKENGRVPQSLSKVILHVVFSTKNRERIITDGLKTNLQAYLAGICRAKASEALRVGGTDNHVHLACTLPRTLTQSKLLEEIKKSSSAWIKKQPGAPGHFSWQAGYGAFSVSQSQLPELMRYIDRQEKHHRIKTFEEELVELLTKYAVKHDEKYLWD